MAPATDVPALPPSFQALDERARDILVVLALDHREASRSSWLDRVGAAGIVERPGKKFSGLVFQDLLDRTFAREVFDPKAASYAVAPSVVPAVLEDAQRRGRLLPIVTALSTPRREFGYAEHRLGPAASLRVALVTRDAPAAARLERTFMEPGPEWARRTFPGALGYTPPPVWLEVLSPAARATYATQAALDAFVHLERLGPQLLELALASSEMQTVATAATLAAFSGQLERAREALADRPRGGWFKGAEALVALVAGDVAGARSLMEQAGSTVRGKRVELPGWLALFDVLLAATSNDVMLLADAERRLVAASRKIAHYPASVLALQILSAARRGRSAVAPPHTPSHWLDVLVSSAASAAMGISFPSTKVVEGVRSQAREQGYAWLAQELGRLAARGPKGGLLAVLEAKESWELALDALGNVAAQSTTEPALEAKGPASRLVWTVTLAGDETWVDVEAFQVGVRGGKGTRMACTALLKAPAGTVEPRDLKVAGEIEAARARGDFLLPPAVVESLVGHPYVRDALGRALEVVVGEPRLELEQTANGARVSIVPRRFGRGGVGVSREDDRLVVYRQTASSARLVAALPNGSLVVPPQGVARLREVLTALGSSFTVAGSALEASRTEPADGTLRLQLLRSGSGLRVRVRVQPGGAVGPALRPGLAPAEVVVEEEGALVRRVRDLAQERARQSALLDRCPVLSSLPEENGERVARDLETCLELVFELRALGEGVRVEWLAGEPLRAPLLRTTSDLRVRVREVKTWLSIEGDLAVEEGRVLSMQALLEARASASGRFVPLGDDQYLVLTEDLQRKLDALARAEKLGPDGRLPAALLGVDELWDGLDVSFSAALEARRTALEAARALAPIVPRTLRAELRDYQREGFAFLVRRAAAGLGACLADDMGLGKTVQAIAFLLHRRKKGPALVVVPTSVRRNWEDELARFAPSLEITRFGEGDREEEVRAAKAGDVLLVTYGLLAAATKLLGAKTFATVIFDEAHALKNATTQRWAAARELRAEALVALTGTPLENHAGELHALLDVLVPGMLGSRASFDRALGAPIASGDRDAAALLRRIVRPLVLRRTKEEVLAELPPKTEITTLVAPSGEQLAFCEAIRRKALARLAAARNEKRAAAGRARLDLLAELLRLRRAAIDPRLVGGEAAPAGTKLDALVELVTELRAEGRRALVFSQFLEVLDMAGERLAAAGATCLRFDGSLTEGARADVVARFQDGEADLLLVSLKAGGVGMNLTAADFVVFLDPWWNPAIEDQAAARAHRMGQLRPVTVVRLVTESTIEEKIVALHAQKRQLYADIVSEADGAGTLSVEAIGALLEG